MQALGKSLAARAKRRLMSIAANQDKGHALSTDVTDAVNNIVPMSKFPSEHGASNAHVKPRQVPLVRPTMRKFF